MKFYLMCLALCALVPLRAQNISVYANSNLQPIEKVALEIGSAVGVYGTTNAKGSIFLKSENVPSDPSTLLIFFKSGFETKILTWGELQKRSFEVYLVEKVNDLDEVVVSASKFEEKKGDVSQKIQVLNSRELENMNQTSMADVMMQSGNVMVQKSQLGGGSPIIRGFETNRVLMVVDGVRMNNAIYRGGHLQNIITLDNATMDRVEVVFGPGSVIYGSDAMGGVMHFFTKNPSMSNSKEVLLRANSYKRYMSASNGYAANANVSVANNRFGSLTSFTYSKFGDLRQGTVRNPFYGSFGSRNFYVERVEGKDSSFVNLDSNLQVQSGYTQYDVMQKFTFVQNENISHHLNLQYSTSSDIPRYDRLSQVKNGKPEFAQWYYGPQERLFAAYTVNFDKKYKLYDQAKLVLGHQQIEESRHNRSFQSVNLNHRMENVKIYTLNGDFEKQIGEHELRFGVEAYLNEVASSAYGENIETGARKNIDTRYPDGGSSMNSAAIYLTDVWEIKDRLILNAGVRGTYVGLNAKFNDTTFFPFPFSTVKQKNIAANGNIGLIYSPNKNWRFTWVTSTGFRAPNVDDLTKVFESTPGNIVVPNPNLSPEYIYSTELGASKRFHDKVTLSLTAYASYLTNALTVQNGTFNGQDSILYEGKLSKVTTTQNAAEAYVYGIESGLSGNLTERLAINASYNFTYGRIVTDTTDYPLDHIPPGFGKIGFSYKVTRFSAEAFCQFAGWKRLKDYNLVGEDNHKSATPYGMPAWYTLNIRASYQFNKYFGLQLACENILDHNYRVFASNISAPGRNLIATLRVNL